MPQFSVGVRPEHERPDNGAELIPIYLADGQANINHKNASIVGGIGQ